MNPTLAIVGVFLGCCCNVVFLELLVGEDPGSGNLITFSQFLLISLEGLIFTSKFFSQKPKIGLKDYFLLVVMFFLANVCNNYAFDFHIPMPLHMIFRAGSLIANMIMGIIMLKKRYTFIKYLSVFMITFGITICTYESGKDVKPTGFNPAPSNPETDILWWTVGIILLTVALFVSARMGIYQEVLYDRYGKHAREALFYTHLMPLPGFIIFYDNIIQHFQLFLNSEPITINAGLFALTMPKLIFYLLGNVFTQYLCISSVYVLTTECTSLAVTLVVTLRKFISLLFSIVYFGNEFTAIHWVGTISVFTGTLLFTEVIQRIVKFMQGDKVIKKD